MHAFRLISVLTILVAASVLPAAAQNQGKGAPQPPPIAPAKPYKPVAVTPPKPFDDPAFVAMRKQLAAAAQKKDRAALAKLVVTQGFFWEKDTGDSADKKKSGIDNLSAALGLSGKDGAGWDILASYGDEPNAMPSAEPEHKGAVCAPGDPDFDGEAFEALLKATGTDASEWGVPVSANIEVHAGPQANAAVTGKLGAALVRVLPETGAQPSSYIPVVTPDGKTGYVSADSVAPLGSDQLCYVKDGGAWKIAGYIGAGNGQ
ncbi:MAG TPA: SH3 domain-containing protein [Pseudolabrys sp.]|nr:SH3 domain-containing protein [Pseudolabrys sp.]